MAKVKKMARKRTVRNAKIVGRSVKKTMPKIDIKELDPIRKCGPGTSVQVLLRVIERADGVTTSHLVFFDKHGWYCDHGRGCPAVALARKQRRRLATTTRPRR